MKTASFFSYQGAGRIAITRGSPPRGTTRGYRIYRTLAPRWDMLQMPYDEYRGIFFNEILRPLDPVRVEAELCDLAGKFEPVLLCFERPPFHASNWCHRRMVAEWFADKLGIEIPEIEA